MNVTSQTAEQWRDHGRRAWTSFPKRATRGLLCRARNAWVAAWPAASHGRTFTSPT
jgi:hypothetical protein